MEVPAELTERMANMLRAYISDRPPPMVNGRSMYSEAVDIVSLLPEPVDPDLIEAQEMATKNGWVIFGPVFETLVAAIKRGRELERGK